MRMRGWISQFYARGLPKVSLAIEKAEGEGNTATVEDQPLPLNLRQRGAGVSAGVKGDSSAW